MSKPFPRTPKEQSEHFRRVQDTYARAMRVERAGAMDEPGLRAKWIIWWDLSASPALLSTRATLWKHRNFLLGCVSAVLALAGVVVAALALHH